MCVAESECGSRASCVAGRCVAHDATPAIATARRVLYEPVDMAYVSREGGAEIPVMAALGRDDGALVLLRFSIPLTPEVEVLEAYLLLERAADVDSDPTPITLHAARVLDPWEARSVGWAWQPRIEQVGAPVTRVSPSSGALVRLDVRRIVQRWMRRRGEDRGLAVVSGAKSTTGIAFALAPGPGSAHHGSIARSESSGTAGPRLELYLR
jgi:hypothetical protein